MATTKKKGRAANAAQDKQARRHSAKDSRTQVLQQQRQRERLEAPYYSTTKDRKAELRQIAATTFGYELRVIKAMRTGELTEEESYQHLDTKETHARLDAIKKRLPVFSRWVKTLTATGNVRRVKAYRLAPNEEGAQ